MLSSHPGTYYLCKEKCRYYPRIEGIGDHEEVQGHTPTFLGNTNTIGDPTHVPCPLACQRRDIHSESRRPNPSAESGRENVHPDPPKAKRRRIRTVRCRERMAYYQKYGDPEGFSWKHKREKIGSAYIVGCRFLLEMPTNNALTSLPQSLST